VGILILRGSGSGGGGGGSVADGATYNFTSTASSTKSQTVSFLGGLGGYLDSFTDKTRANPPPTNWVGPDNPTGGAGPGGEYPQVTSDMPTASNAPVLTRKALGYYDYTVGGVHISNGNASNWDAFGYAYNHGAAIPEYLHHGYVYFGHTDTTNTTLQWKILRDSTSPVTIVDGSPQARYFHWKRPAGEDSFVTTGPNGQFTSGVYFEGDNTATFPAGGLPAFNTGEWYRWEFWKLCSSGTSTADGSVKLRMWRYSDGAAMADYAFPNQTQYTDASRTQYVIMQNYFGNGNGTLVEPAGGFAYWCDPGIQAGSVGSAYRSIWLGDASTYAACNKGKLIYQPDSGSWSGTSRTVTLNKGHYASITGQSLWLYERDNSGNAVNSSGILLA
jgi:hypothetical protein